MLAAVPPLVALLGLGLYFVPVALGRASFRRVPVVSLALVALGAAAAIVLVALALLVFAGWFFFRFSMYAAREDRPAAGDRFPEFAFPDSTGGTFRLADARGRRVLVMLCRGYW